MTGGDATALAIESEGASKNVSGNFSRIETLFNSSMGTNEANFGA